MKSFKLFFEAVDIFGFNKRDEIQPKEIDDKPIKRFNLEEMIKYLSLKNVGLKQPVVNFMNEIQWGTDPGSLKLEITPRSVFFIKKLSPDLHGNYRWITKKSFQLNQKGIGGYEDAIANEIYEKIIELDKDNLDSPQVNDFNLQKLVETISSKVRRTMNDLFIFQGIKKLADDNFLIRFGLTGHGLEAKDHKKVNEVQLQVSLDRKKGSIRVCSYKLLHKTGEDVQFNLNPSDLDVYFYPSQDMNEISEVVAVHMKYY